MLFNALIPRSSTVHRVAYTASMTAQFVGYRRIISLDGRQYECQRGIRQRLTCIPQRSRNQGFIQPPSRGEYSPPLKPMYSPLREDHQLPPSGEKKSLPEFFHQAEMHPTHAEVDAAFNAAFGGFLNIFLSRVCAYVGLM